MGKEESSLSSLAVEESTLSVIGTLILWDTELIDREKVRREESRFPLS